jgi:cathepsin B
VFAAADTLACQNFGSNGCNGGQPGLAWNFFVNTGVVSGGDYGDSTTCSPYPFAPCAHHVAPSAEYPACPTNDYNTPRCSKSCTNSAYGTSYSSDKTKAKSSYSISGVSKIQTDIMTYGSVSAAFTVYNDFLAYSGGVYQYKSGSALGGHAVKIFGWGVDNGTPYWNVANSWNPTWGVGGTFKILRGGNECGIEGDIVAGLAA